MSVYYNMAGTTYPSFKIGKAGPTLFQGNYTPSSNSLSPYYVPGNPGDLFIRNGAGATPSIFVFDTGTWQQKADWIQNGPDAVITSNVGIGVSSVTAGSVLTVNGTMNLLGIGNGIYFPDGTFQSSSASASAAGIAGEIQFNDGAGSFAADAALVWDNTNQRLGVGSYSPISSIQYKYTALESTASSVSTMAQTAIDSFKVVDIRSAHYYIQVTDEDLSTYQITQVTVVHDGLTAFKSEYNILCSAAKLGEFDVLVQGLNVNLLFTPFTATNKTIKVNRSSMVI